jgi:tRNA pseudouridine13 synthase
MQLPYITPELPGINGQIKIEPEDFQVTEIPLYEPSNEGQHLYITIKRKNLNTKDVVKILMDTFSISEKDIGHAGLKDKNALTTQCFSLSLGVKYSIAKAKEVLDITPEFEVLKIERHENKLKTGHLKGNQFSILIKDVDPDAYQKAENIKNRILITGIPNYYGPQRFGSKGDNWEKGLELLKGERKEKRSWLKKLYYSALQSYLFNQWLKARIDNKKFSVLLNGDHLIGTTGSRTFPYDKEKNHIEEFNAGEISYTGPMFGHKITWDENELDILQANNLNISQFKNKFLMGTRRSAVLRVKDISIEELNNAIKFKFTLPAGHYATTILREFMKNELIDSA